MLEHLKKSIYVILEIHHLSALLHAYNLKLKLYSKFIISRDWNLHHHRGTLKVKTASLIPDGIQSTTARKLKLLKVNQYRSNLFIPFSFTHGKSKT